MSGFRAVNTTLTTSDSPSGKSGEAMTPTTPRPIKLFQPEPPSEGAQPSDDPSAKTPTRDSFHGISGQRPLPSAPYTPPQEEKTEVPVSEPPRKHPGRESAHKSTKSLDAQDVDMQDDELDEDGSDNESMNSDSTRPAKKKKGQRFFCTDFPPCQLSFTRSEHLARHIRYSHPHFHMQRRTNTIHRKHTGERPFQCHCSRRFSRLDNLRQHAQTVHVNEDIPGDSLAATGTRFQRQIRTDRVRPPPSRSRASTLSTSGPHSRGHSRNLSTSSIASTVSTISTVSHVSQQDDFRRRPATLAMANNTDLPHRQRLSLDTFNPQLLGGSPGPTFYNQPEARSPSGYSTPPSASYSSANASPRFSGIGSPMPTASRPYSYGGPSSSHNRRLSQPASGSQNPFQPAPGPGSYSQSPYMTPLPSGTGSALQSSTSSIYASPTTSTFPNTGDHQETSAEAEWRRRTWHPSTHTQMRPATSGLSRFETPSSPTPEGTSAQGPTRLPGIESFDHAPPLPALPRLGSPMQIDTPTQQQPGDIGIQQGIKRLEIANPDSRNEHRQPHQPSVAEQYQALVMHPSHPSQAPPPPPPQLPSLRHPEPIGAPPPVPQRSALRASAYHPTSQPKHQSVPQAAHQPITQYATQAAPTVVRFDDATPRHNKRFGWVNGPISSPLLNEEQPNKHTQHGQGAPPGEHPPQMPIRSSHSRGSSTNTVRTSPEDSSSSEGVPTPSSSNLSGWNPAVRNSDGYIAGRPSSGDFVKPFQRYEHRPDIANWSLQNAQTESRKREREELHQRDSGVELGQASTPHIDSGMRRLEALVAVATEESRA